MASYERICKKIGKRLVSRKTCAVVVLCSLILLLNESSYGIVHRKLGGDPFEIATVQVINPTHDRVADNNEGLKGDWWCAWSPDDRQKCNDILQTRLPPPISNSNSQRDEYEGMPPLDSQRWIFLGDSTMKRLFDKSNLQPFLIREPLLMADDDCFGRVSCSEHLLTGRCEVNKIFGMPYAEQWIAPDPSKFEGPIKFGSWGGNEYCTDCSGCQTHFLECNPSDGTLAGAFNNDNTSLGRSLSKPQKCDNTIRKQRYGGYMTMEFARDTEMQTPEFQTTQESTAAYLAKVWNTPNMITNWGKPICVIGAGNHDVVINGITTKDFVKNVKFMLETMMNECGFMIWLGNTSNILEKSHPEFSQTKENILEWDRAVRSMIESTPELFRMMSYVEVAESSYTLPHNVHDDGRPDFIHMDTDWYQQLGQWFISLM